MIGVFMHGWPDNDNGVPLFDKSNLIEGKQYAVDLMEDYGMKKEPFHGYDLKQFIDWCEARLTSGAPTKGDI